MQAEIITIGDELLIGQTVDTNSAWIGAELSSLGFDIYRITSVSDKRNEILKVLNEVSGRSDVVLITGGLGPTSDDITKQTLCEFFNTKLVINDEVLLMIKNMLSRRNFPLNENNRRQAEVPESCRVLFNATGTAPGMWLEKDRTIFISMPGVPMEMKHIMTEHVLPELHKKFRSQVIIHKNIMVYGAPEARLAEMLVDFEAGLPQSIRMAYLPSYGFIKLRLTARGSSREILEGEVKAQCNKLYDTIPQLIYGEDGETMEMVVGRLLKEKKKTMATAESCTGGNIAHMMTSIPGSSDYYIGSVVAYDNRIKTDILKVQEHIISDFGAVSRETAEAMALGVVRLLKSDYGVAVTGIAGPAGGSDEKPVGTTWIAVASKAGVVSEKYTYGADRIMNIKRSSLAAINLLRKQIISEKE